MLYKPKSITLRQVPEDVYRELLRVQGQEKARRNTQFNLEQTVYKIIKSNMKKEN